MTRTGRLSHRSRSVSRLLALAFLLNGASASLCVWRSPDRDIAEMYEADGYKTVFEDVTDQLALRIERRLGLELDPDETQFKFFPVFRGEEQVGTVMSHVGKGQFGAIEVVVALVETDSVATIKAVRIQRDREKAKQALRSERFLGQFRGRIGSDLFVIGEDLVTAVEGAEIASQAVATAVRKLVVVYEEFYHPGADSRIDGNGAGSAEEDTE